VKFADKINFDRMNMNKTKCDRAKLKKLALVLGALLLLPLLAACNSEESTLTLSDVETVLYEHPSNGAALTIPASWKKLSEMDNAVVFADADNTISLTVVLELGGFTYFSDSGLLDVAEEVASQVLNQPEVVQSLVWSAPKEIVQLTAAGTLQEDKANTAENAADSAEVAADTAEVNENAAEDTDKAENGENTESGENAICEVAIVSPIPAVRYYIVAVAEVDAYKENAQLLSDIYAGFYLNKSEDEMYEGLAALNQ
jgi:hypothetical protein